MSELLVDPLKVARDMQWDIEGNTDPVQASLLAADALRMIGPFMSDERYIPGTQLIIEAFKAYVFHQATEETPRQVLEYEGLEARGDFGGIGFIQNHEEPELQTLYVAARNASIFVKEGERLARTGERVPSLVIPVLFVENFKLAA